MRTLTLLIGLFYFSNSWGQDFKPDTTVNQINLESRKSVIKKLKSDTAYIEKYLHRLGEPGSTGMPHLDIRTTNQLLTLYFHPGNWTWAFSEFKVQPLDKGAATSRMVSLRDNEFATEKGIKLGTTKSELIKRIGRPTATKTEKGFEIIEYRTNDQNSRILKSYGQAGYFAIYKLKDNRIVEFHFGFDMP